MISPFLDRRHGLPGIELLARGLRRSSPTTNGVVVYHEQVIRGIAAVTGCSLDDADYVRRHLDAGGRRLPGDPDSRPVARTARRCTRTFRMNPSVRMEQRPARPTTALPARSRSRRRGTLSPAPKAPRYDPPEPWRDVGEWFRGGRCETASHADPVREGGLLVRVVRVLQAHAAAFASLLISAWLKAHHPANSSRGPHP